MTKVDVHINLDYDLLIRAKHNKLNLSKEINTYLERLLALPKFDMPSNFDEIDKQFKEKELELERILNELNSFKIKKEEIIKKDKEEKVERIKWKKVPVK